MVDAGGRDDKYKHIEAWNHSHPGQELKGDAQWRVIGDAAAGSWPFFRC